MDDHRRETETVTDDIAQIGLDILSGLAVVLLLALVIRLILGALN
jgi:hypothetical protein